MSRTVCCLFSCLLLAPAFALDGTVFDRAGQPVSGAQVGLPQGSHTLTTTTDPLGRFHLEFDVADATMTVVAQTPGAWGWYRGPSAARIAVIVQPTAEFAGVLRDERGRAVGGARLTVTMVGERPHERRAWPGEPWPAVVVTTDDTGHWRWRGLPAGWYYSFAVEHPDYVPCEREFRGSTDATPHMRTMPDERLPERVVEQQLVRGETLTGHVRLADGQPLSGVTVEARAGGVSVRHTTTAADGSYRLTGLPSPLSALVLRDPRGLLVAAPKLDLEHDGDPPWLADLVAVAGQPVTVRTVVGGTGQPAAGVGLTLVDENDEPLDDFARTTDAAGQVRLKLAEGTYGFKVEPPAGLLDEPGEEGYAVTVERRGAPQPLTITLWPRRELVGHVRTPAGQPLAGVRVTAKDRLGEVDDEAPEPAGLSVETDATGRFVLHGRSSHAPLRLKVAELDGYPLARVEFAAGELPPGELALTATPLPRVDLTVQVVDNHGQPVPEAQVTLARGERGDEREADCDARGLARFARLPAVAGFSAVAKTHELGRSAETLVTLEAGRLVVPPLVLDRRDASVGGLVVDAAGRPVKDAVVLVRGLREAEAVTGADGRFTVSGLPSQPLAGVVQGGKVVLLALHGTLARAEGKATVGAADVRLKVGPGVEATDEDRREVAAAALQRCWREAQPDDREQVELLQALALVDPPGVVEALARLRDDQPERDAWLSAGMVALAHAAPALCAEQLGWLAKIRDRETRVLARASVALALPVAQRREAALLYEAIRDQTSARGRVLAVDLAALAARLGRPEALALARAALRARQPEAEGVSVRPYAAWRWGGEPALLALVDAATTPDERALVDLLGSLGLAARDPQAAYERFIAGAFGTDGPALATRLVPPLAAVLATTAPALAEQLVGPYRAETAVPVYRRLAALTAEPAAQRRLATKAALALSCNGPEPFPSEALAWVGRAAPDLANQLWRSLGPENSPLPPGPNRLLQLAERRAGVPNPEDGRYEPDNLELGELDPRRALELALAEPDASSLRALGLRLAGPDVTRCWLVAPEEAALDLAERGRPRP